jgi:hypothetical protein
MREIGEIKADIEFYSACGSQEEIDRVWLEWFRCIAQGIEPSELETQCQSWRENRVVVLPVKVGDIVETKHGIGEIVAWDTTARVKINDEPDFAKRYRDYDVCSKIFTCKTIEASIKED